MVPKMVPAYGVRAAARALRPVAINAARHTLSSAGSSSSLAARTPAQAARCFVAASAPRLSKARWRPDQEHKIIDAEKERKARADAREAGWHLVLQSLIPAP